ncbi:Pentatricopeptide repeat-containing protein [Artemisia annua]|uniref:Pentatricopeptide repeat-containing protein n=1 Tax=Artemisia annua TaxID=35608 RepID=A0A2U1KET9_ARTAN|nr:Pentatricopeptide repeat-containing protein [Artemisia annua]
MSSLTISNNPFQTNHHQPKPFNKNHNLTFSSKTHSPNQKPTSESLSWVEKLRYQTRSNNFHEAISVYIDMTTSGHKPDNFAFPAVLKAVTELQELRLGEQVHGAVVKLGYDASSVTVANTLLNLYGKCGGLSDVVKVFDKINEKDRVSWNTMIASLCRLEEWELALDMFRRMLIDGVQPNSFTLVSMSVACSNLETRRGVMLGKQVHGYCLRNGESMSFTNNSLMSMYAKLGRIEDSVSIFDIFADKNMVSWNTMISSLSQKDRFQEAMDVFRVMIVDGMKPDGVTIASVLPACSHLELLDHGKEIHAYALRSGSLIENSYVCSALVDMYCNCRKVGTGRRVFDELVNRSLANWNAMLAGYTQNGYYDDALMLFLDMLESSRLLPNPTTMASVLPASVHCGSFLDKESMHGYVAKMGFLEDGYVQNALMDLYSRMGKVSIARNIFDNMQIRDTVSWNTIITGYVVCGCHEHALDLLHKMTQIDETNGIKKAKCKPNSITLMTVLPGCAALSALAKGKEIHAYAIRNLLATDVAVGSALTDMYAKCGCLTLARNVFDSMPIRNVITWNVMFMAYGMHGKGDVALSLLEKMVAEVKPNEVTFISLFAACSHSGMVNEGRNLFQRMKDEYGVDPTEDHYGCVVDLLGRAGQLAEAHELINSMPPWFSKVSAWSSLLGACWIHQNVELGEIAAEHLLELEPDVASHYVLLSNIYSAAGLWEKATQVRKNMIRNGVKKEPGCSWIEFDDEVHKFVSGDYSHPQSEKLYGFLETLSERLKQEGYVPDTSCVLHNVNEEEKETLLCGHSERLAIAFGLLNMPPGVPIRVAKNLRVCNDCHSATKFISKVVEREIIVRDVRRFHYFKDGQCSCGDYW